jgi:hypothetical protein
VPAEVTNDQQHQQKDEVLHFSTFAGNSCDSTDSY